MKPNLRLASAIWALGVAGFIFSCRLAEIHRHTGDVAINDQWKIEAADLIGPWLDGRLGPWDFLAPHFEHLPVWTRLASWLQVVLTGRWDPFFQTTFNALLFSGFAFLVTRWIAAHLRPAMGIAAGLIMVAGGASPYAWENITWGFQSQFPFALIFLFLHVHGSFGHPPGSRGWWWSQLAGFAGLFTLAGMWIAPFAVALASFWAKPRGSRLHLAPLGVAACGLLLIALIKLNAPPLGAFAQTAPTPMHFLHAWLDLLGWPAGWPGAYLVINLPLVLLALRLRGSGGLPAFEGTAFALGLWGVGQAAALAFARGADYGGYVSRYGELHLVLVLANAAALGRLLPQGKLHLRLVPLLFAAAWSGVVLAGWWQLSHGGHTAYFHANSVANADARRHAVQAYLEKGDRSWLEMPETRRILYQDVGQITRLLDQPRFRSVLPSSVNPLNPPDRAGTMVRRLQSHAMGLVAVACMLLAVGAVLIWCSPRAPVADLPHASPGRVWPWCLAAACCAFGLLYYWSNPLVFPSTSRWRHLIQPEDGSVAPLEVQIVRGSQEYPPDRLVGAAPLTPEGLRLLFTGTEPEGPGLTCTAWSRAFPILRPWLVVPYAGWPVSHGNGLRLRIEAPDGREITEIACPVPNPQGIQFWTADVRPHLGRQARLVLYDGRTDTEAWVAAAAPIATENPDLGALLARRLARERLMPLHTSLALTSLALGLAAAAGFVSRRQRA